MKKLLEHTRRPDISFVRNGAIRISSRVVRALSLRPGDSINIAVSDGEYLLYAVTHSGDFGRHVAQCFRSKYGSNNLCAQSVALCRGLLDSAGISAYRASFMVGQPIERAGVKYVPIITLHPL